MRELLLGIDIGTSACKVAVFDTSGNVITSLNGKYHAIHTQDGWAEQNPEDWWNAVIACIREILTDGNVKASEISAIGIDGISWAAVAMDNQGECLCNTPLWFDTRSQEICDELNRNLGRENIFSISGNPMKPGYTTPKVLWYKKFMPEIYSRINKILQCNGYIAFKLTGEYSQDLSQGYGWHCFDMRTGKWDDRMISEMQLNKNFLPEIVACDKVIGCVSHVAAIQTGLCEGTPVVAGGLDAACGTLGAGVIHDGETQEQGGQAGGMSICTNECVSDERLILSFHVIPNKWLLQGGTTGGGGVIRWFSENFATDFSEINNLAAKIPAGCDGLVFLPYMMGERTPIWDPNAKGVFYGIDFAKSKAHFVRACMEGVALALRHNLTVAEEAGAKIHDLRSMGGSANSLLWTQIKSDVTNRKIFVPSSDTATTLGAAMLAGVGVGIYRDYDEAVSKTVRITREHEPNFENYAIYNKIYETYIELYESLKNLMQKSGGKLSA